MITKIEIDGKKHIAVVFGDFDTLENVSALQNAVCYSIKAIANSDYACGLNPDLYELANLLQEMLLTPNQAAKADKAIF
jgi:hypothetical protein